MNHFKPFMALGSALAAAALLLAPASGQAARATEAIMEEVLVYGTKTSAAQNVQDVAGQVIAYGTEQLEAMHVLNVEDLSFATPNVQLDGVGTQPSYAAFSIRGLGVDNSIPSVDPNVGVFVDGAYLGVPFGVIMDTFDLESVEIHKGPQGLLFGRNVTGGALLLRSRRPTGETGVSGRFGIETGLQYTTAFAAEGATEDGRLAGRLAVQYKTDSGWFDNEGTDSKAGASDSRLARLSLLYTPASGSEHALILESGRLDGEGTPVQGSFVAGVPPREGLTVTGQYSYEIPITPDTDEFEVNYDHLGAGDAEWNQATWEVSMEAGPGQLTNLLSFREVNAFASADIDGLATPGIITFYFLDQDQVSNEVRYNITLFDRWDLTAGLYYYSQRYEYETGLVTGMGTTNLVFDADVGGGHRRGGGRLDQETLALYMNNEFRLTDSLALYGGFNLSQEHKDVRIAPRLTPAMIDMGSDDFKNSPYANACDFETGCNWSRAYAIPAKETWVNIAPKAGARWFITDDMQIYGHVSSAFRSGFYSFRQTNTHLLLPGPNGKGPEPTDVEEHYAAEFGIKSHFWDSRLRVNGAIFTQEISDLARSTAFTLPGGEPAQDLINVGDARINGWEAEVQVAPIDNLLVEFAAGFLDGKITEATADINRDGEINSLDEGLDIVRLSELTYNVNVTYDLPVGRQELLTFSASYAFRDEAAATDSNTAYFPELEMVNASVSYGATDGSWKLSLYGRNILDQVVYKTVFPISRWRVYAPIAEGARYGMEFSYNF